MPAEWEFTPSPLLPFGDGAYITEEYGWFGEQVWWTLHHCALCEDYEVDAEGLQVVLQAGRALGKLDNLFRLGGTE